MLEKIEEKEIMTKRAARDKYENKYFLMAITETVDWLDNDLGYVIYIADSKKELTEVPREVFAEMRIASMEGCMAPPHHSYGGLEVIYYS